MKDELRGFIIDNYLFGHPIRFSDQDSFTATGLIDSTGMLELVAFLEERCGIIIDDEDLLLDNLDSIDKLLGYLERKGVAAPPPVAAAA